MKKARLAEEIRFELAQLDRVAQLASSLAAVSRGKMAPWDAAAAAKIVGDVSLGLENLCKRRSTHVGGPWPDGPMSHSRALEEFLSGSGPGFSLPDETKERLRRYLKFRHRFVHGYSIEVRWEMVEEPLALIPQTVAELRRAWETWLGQLPEDQA